MDTDYDYGSELDPGCGPTAQTGTSASQPLTTEALRLLSRYRRTASDRAKARAYAAGKVKGTLMWYASTISFPEEEVQTIEQFRNAVFRVIVQRLEAHQIPTQRLSKATLSWCLPKE